MEQATTVTSSRSVIQQPGAVRPQLKCVLHVGCGPANPLSLHERFRGQEWREIRLDIDPHVAPDIVASLTDMSAVETDSVDAIWSSHNLEHLYAHEVPIALAEFHRVLRPGAFALVTMPDLEQVAHFVVADKLEEVVYISPAGPITALDCIYGHRGMVGSGNHFMAHKTGFTATSLSKHLRQAGFACIRTWFSPFGLWAEATKI
jgi:SAM-dependent methyltransferase